MLDLSGVLTAGGAREVCERMRDELATADARALVVDMRHCVPLMTPDGWARLSDVTSAATCQHPAALVTAPALREQARRYCREMGARGFLRLAFVDVEQAVSWASRRMEHWDWAPVRRPVRRPAVAAEAGAR